ncbi:MAG: radical SAM protein [Acidimicrobiales bacterium]|nr:radical SAM protein [Acidimicrobiales bacterium]
MGASGRSVVDVPRRVRGKVGVLRRDAQRRRLGTPCLAPYANLYLGPQGEVRACCVQSQYLGNIRVQRLPEIWNGVQQLELRRHLGEQDYSYGCGFCGWQDERGIGTYARYYDVLDVRAPAPAFPIRMEFALTNACNLQCTMCSGENSSAIRIHREGRSASPRSYGDRFFEDLEAFIPHLRHANFVGGEPFLGPENYRVWDLLARHGGPAAIDITTNATQWDPRVEEVLRTLRPAVQVSIDGTTPATFESIRQGSDFHEVMANVERFLGHAREVGTRVDISHCLMPQNHHEFGDLLLYAEARGMKVHVGVVTTPADHSMERLDASELATVLASLRAQAERVLPQLRGHNASALVQQVDRVRTWVEQRDEQEPAETIEYEQVLGFPRRARSGGDRVVVGARLEEPANPGVDLDALLGRRLDRASRVLEVGPNDIIRDCSPEAADWLGVERASVIGIHVDRLDDALARRFGTLTPEPELDAELDADAEGLGATGEVVERTYTATTGIAAADTDVDGPDSVPRAELCRVRTVSAAVRDRSGWIVHVVLAIGHPAR